jgi:iron complex outermembrane receptor protein
MHADANWTDKQYYTAFNTQDSSSPAHWESNLRVALTSNDGKFDIGVWGKNLNDNTANTWVVANAATGTRFTTIPYPRRYGVDFRWNF